MLDAAVKGNSTGDPELDGLIHRIEEEERDMIGPWSTFKPFPEHGTKKVEEVVSPKELPDGFDEISWGRAEDRYAAKIGSQSISPLSRESAISGVSTGTTGEQEGGMDTSTNSGLPWVTSGWRPNANTKGENVDRLTRVHHEVLKYASDATELWKQKDPRLFEMPFLTFYRLVQKGEKPYADKSYRVVMAPGKWEAIIGRQYVYPATEKLRTLRSPGGNLVHVAWLDLKAQDLDAQLILRRANQQGYTVVSGDISSMDASLVPQLWERIGRLQGSWIRGWENLVDNHTKTLVNHKIVVCPTGIFGPVPSSMPSGSSKTNLDDSAYLEIALLYGEERGYYKIDTYRIQGDDFNIGGDGVNPESVAKALSECGLNAHPDKQFYEPNALMFLQRLHYLDRPGGIYSAYRTLGKALGFERLQFSPKDWNSYAYTIRTLTQVQNNVFSPHFTSLVDVLKTGDPKKLGSDLSDPMEVVRESGAAGAYILGERQRATWTGDDGAATSFNNWLVNGYLRGEDVPRSPETLFSRVHGVSSSTIVGS
jgi:hypothetical protein